MARMARVVALGIPHHITQQGNRRHGSGNKYGVPGIQEFVRAGVAQGRRPELVGGGLIRSLGGWSQVLPLRRRGVKVASDERILGSGEFIERLRAEAAHQERDTLRFARKVVALATVERTLCTGERIGGGRPPRRAAHPEGGPGPAVVLPSRGAGNGVFGGGSGAVPGRHDVGRQPAGRVGRPATDSEIPQSVLEPT